MPEVDNFTKAITRKYWWELGGAMTAYVIVLFAAIPLMTRSDDLLVRSLLILMPMVPLILATVAIYRHVQRMDEFQRLQSFKVIAISAAGTALLSIAYGFLELAGLPKLSMMAVWPVMGTIWLTTNLLLRIKRRHHP